jgi:flagellar protein FlaJ
MVQELLFGLPQHSLATVLQARGLLFGPLGIVAISLVVLIIALWTGDKVSTRIERMLNRISMALFRRFVSSNFERQRRIEAAYSETTYRNYAAKTLLFASMAFVAGAVTGSLIVAVVLLFLEPIVQVLAELPVGGVLGVSTDFSFDLNPSLEWILLVSFSATLFGGIAAGISYAVRWWLPSSTAEVRRRAINEGLTRTTAFMFALSRGGMEFPQILRTLTQHKHVYGETANEMTIAVREMDLFGRDMITSLRRMSSRTPSEGFKTFSENLTSVLQSGRDLSGFLKEQFERFRQEAEERQEDMLELLSTLAEAYVTILVAGMLFFVTILLIFGMTISETLLFLQVTVYVLIPVLNAGFALFVQQQLDTFGIGGMGGSAGVSTMDEANITTPMAALPDRPDRQPDGGYAAREQEGRRMLDLHDRLGRVKTAISSPLEVVFWNPAKILWVTLPIAVLMFVVRFPSVIQAEGINERVLDDLLIQSLLFLSATFAVARYIHKRHIERIESATPEFLERLASLNDAGMSIVQALDRVRGTDLGVLTPELERIWRDIETGSTVDDAFLRFGRRVRTRAIARVVTLLTNAMRASGNMGPVVRIAAEQQRAELSLRRQRRQQMLTYLVVIYISFFVFLVIILAVNEMLVPNIPESSPVGDSGAQAIGAGGAFGNFGGVDQTAYTLVFFHAALVQAVCAGFVGGQLGEGSLRDGAKHAAIMLGIAYFAFIFLSSPIASVVTEEETFQEGAALQNNFEYDVVIQNGQITQIDEFSTSQGGFLAAYQSPRGGKTGINSTYLGVSDYRITGSHSDVAIPVNQTRLDKMIDNETLALDLRLIPHKDTNGNNEFDFPADSEPYRPGSGQADSPYRTPAEGNEPGVKVTALVRDNVQNT